MTIKVNAKFLAACSLFTAKTDDRPYITGVSIEPHRDGGALMVATNGHIILACHDKEAVIESPILVKPGTKMTKRWREGEIEIGSDAMILQSGKTAGSLIAIERLEGEWTFPDWRRNLPRQRPSMKTDGCLPAGAYMALFDEAGRILGATCKFAPNDHGPWPVIFAPTLTDGSAYGILMPVGEKVYGCPVGSMPPKWVTP